MVPDRYEAAAWYQRVLGLEIVRDYEAWAADPSGPLMISADDGNTKLALFSGQPQPSGGFLVAFRVDASGFAACIRGLALHEVKDRRGQPMGWNSAVDHARAWSIYFQDPYGYQLEVTTYEYDAVLQELKTRDRSEQ